MLEFMRFLHAFRLAAVLSVGGALAGCAAWPDLGDRVAQDAYTTPPPRIAPLPALLDTVEADTALLQAEGEALQARATALRIRAAAIGAGD
jgi:hypothetical protein